MNQLKTGVLLSYITMILGSAISLFYTPVKLHLLGQSEYGLYQLVGSTVSYLGLLSFGLGSAYVRYYSIYKVKNDVDGIAKLNGMYITVFSIMGVVALLSGTILIINIEVLFENSLTVEEIETAKVLMTLMVINLGISFPFSIFSSYITAHEKYIFLKVVQIIKTILNPFLVLPLLLMGYQSISMVVVSMIFNIGTDIIYVRYCRNKLKMRFLFSGFDKKLFREITVFSSFIFINIIVDKVNWNLDKFLLGIYCSTSAVAVYAVASQISTYYISLSTAIASVFVSKINQIVAKSDDNKTLTELLIKVGRVQFLVLALIASGLVIFGKAFIRIWAGEEYIEAYKMVFILVIPATVPLIQNVGIEIQKAKNKHQFRSWTYLIIAICNGLVSIPLCQRYGGIGCAIGTGVSFIIGNGMIMNIYYHKEIGLDMKCFWKQISSMCFGLMIPIALGVVIMMYIDLYKVTTFVLVGVIYMLVYAISMWVISLNRYEKEMFKEIVLKGLKSKKR